jgi:RimJ/RimL family protein N-acetyltransferase
VQDGAIQTERLLLEPPAIGDAEEMAGVLRDPALYLFIGGEPPTPQDLRERWGRQTVGHPPDGTEEWRNWVVRRRDDGAAVGTVQATISDGGRVAVVAWVIGSPWQRNGYATEAAEALVTWLLDRGVRTVEAWIHPDHEASARVAEHARLAPTDRSVDGERVWSLRAGRPTGSISFPLLTQRLLIRPTVEGDAEALHAVWGDDEVTRHLGTPLPSIEATRDLLAAKIAQQERDGFSLWTVEERATGAIVGTVGLQHEDGPEIGLGFLFAKASWGRGYGREAAAATLRAGFEQLGLDRVIGITEETNVRARRVMDAIGMHARGTAHHYGTMWAVYEAMSPVRPS